MKRCAGSNKVTRNAMAPTSARSRWIPCSIRFTAIRVSKRSCKKSLRRNRIVKPQFLDKTKPMPSGSDVKFEIGHVLFIDIIGYSKLLINEQSEQIQTLKQIVRGTEQFRLAEAEGKLLRLPTGDGGALVFRNSPEAPVLCALEITKELQKDTGSKEK